MVERDWALMHAMKAGFGADEIARMLARKSLVDPMDPISSDDVLLRYTVLSEGFALVASLVGVKSPSEKFAALRNLLD